VPRSARSTIAGIAAQPAVVTSMTSVAGVGTAAVRATQ
jgi:hypothetical protein